MSHSGENETTAHIVSLILGLYVNKGDKLHLRFEEECISLMAFLTCIIPCVRDLAWPFDKEEISRFWHHLVIIQDRLGGAALEFAIPLPTSPKLVEEVILDARFMLQTLTKMPSCAIPKLQTLHVNPTTGLHDAPKFEVRISTFYSTWFRSTDAYVKRFRVTREAAIHTVFIGKTKLWNGKTRYSLTWLPHAHLNPKVLHKRGGSSWTTLPCNVNKILRRPALKNEDVDLTALVWNIQGGVNSRLLSNFVVLVEKEKPMLVVLTGTADFDWMPKRVAVYLGYKVLVQKSEEGEFNGFCVLWNPGKIAVQEHRSYQNTKHIRIKICQGHLSNGGKRMKKKVMSILPGCKGKGGLLVGSHVPL